MTRPDARPTRQTDTRADYLLQQLHEAVQRRARVADIQPDLRLKLAHLLALIPTMPAYGSANAIVHGCMDRITEAWRSDALRLIGRRDVETVRSFLASVVIA